MRRLGIDHGHKRVGLSLSDEEGRFAYAHDTIVRKGNGRDVVALAAALVIEKAVGEIVVGLPLNMDGTEGASARRARRFAELLEQASGLPVILWDERMTSVAAERILRESGVKGKKKKDLVDRVAATVILQSYLDSNNRREDVWSPGNS